MWFILDIYPTSPESEKQPSAIIVKNSNETSKI